MGDRSSLGRVRARGAGPTIEVRTIAFPAFSLEDHWNRGDALEAAAAKANARFERG